MKGRRARQPSMCLDASGPCTGRRFPTFARLDFGAKKECAVLAAATAEAAAAVNVHEHPAPGIPSWNHSSSEEEIEGGGAPPRELQQRALCFSVPRNLVNIGKVLGRPEGLENSGPERLRSPKVT